MPPEPASGCPKRSDVVVVDEAAEGADALLDVGLGGVDDALGAVVLDAEEATAEP
jgi:hypothetical protein